MVEAEFLRRPADLDGQGPAPVHRAENLDLHPAIAGHTDLGASVSCPRTVGVLKDESHRLLGLGIDPAPSHVSSRFGLLDLLFHGGMRRDGEALTATLGLCVSELGSARAFSHACPVWNAILPGRTFLEPRILQEVLLCLRLRAGSRKK